MYKLDLETLSEDRLRRAIDADTFRLGKELYERGQVQVVEVTDLTALFVVPDKRNYHVEIKVIRDHVYLKCSCSHASRGLICEHDVAAWLSLRQHLTRLLPEAWQAQLDLVIQNAQDLESIKEEEVVLRLHPRLAPYTAAVLPLSKKPALTKIAHAIAQELRPRWSIDYDETGSIGKRYRRQDEIGTPWCITVDFDTVEGAKRPKDTVTVRDRDTMKQEDVAVGELSAYLQDKLK